MRHGNNEQEAAMNKSIIIYWAVATSWTIGFSLLVYTIGWWIIPAMAVTAITAMCITAQRLFKGA
jgi:hypothetical protein|tara:strand:- start:489 stop:683 length:195 start_codon:yes stop_codon:yes gene_type:complete